MAASSQAISSSSNPLLKEVRRAISAGTLTSDGFAVAESVHLLEEALRSDLAFKAVLVDSSVRDRVEDLLGARRKDIPVRVVEDRLFQRIAATEHSQGVIALVRPPAWCLDDLFRGPTLVVVLDGIQDPGNAGTIARTAEAFGASGILFLRGSVSPFNAKTLRASAGSLFRLPYVCGIDPELAREEFERRELQVFATSSRGQTSLADANLGAAAAVIVGSEAHGLSEVFRTRTQSLRIPTRGVESLNAAAAAAVILYEAARRRAGNRAADNGLERS